MSLKSRLEKILDPGKGKSSEERMAAVIKWAEYVKTHSARDWSRMHNRLIDNSIKKMRALKLTPRQYLEIKGEICRR